MSAPIIWIILPGICGTILFFVQKYKTLVLSVALFVIINLSLAALVIPIDDLVVLGSSTYSLTTHLAISEIHFILTNADRPLLFLIYAITAFFLVGTTVAGVHKKIVPISLWLAAFIVASFAFEPKLNGILFFLPAILISALALSSPGSGVNGDILRFLIYQIIGIAFVLFAGGMIENNPALADEIQGVKIIELLFGVGFIFTLSIFPLYTWVVRVAERAHPYTTTYVLFMVFGGYTIFVSSVLNDLEWLMEINHFVKSIMFIGMVMVISGGIWAAFETNLGRLMGYAVVMEIGYVLLAIVMEDSSIVNVGVIPRVVSFFVWGLGLTVLKSETKSFNFDSIRGFARKSPYASSSILFANFSLAGLPLLAGFPALFKIWNGLATVSLSTSMICLVGNVGLMIGGIHSLTELILKSSDSVSLEEGNIFQKILLSIGIILLFLFGLFPHLVYSLFSNLLTPA